MPLAKNKKGNNKDAAEKQAIDMNVSRHGMFEIYQNEDVMKEEQNCKKPHE